MSISWNYTRSGNPEIYDVNQRIFLALVAPEVKDVGDRPTFQELYNELRDYYWDYKDYKDSEISIQIKKAEEFSPSTKTIHKQFIPVDFLSFQVFRNLFEKELSDLTDSNFKF
ncbi:hypothetical protein Glove_25g11 [Diversispora epigaea]|uniref:Uncharacterized protein n=1 Tax=Diversispora epigaea TaxID=1348612 RepID=A0A397JKT5_9GLOM|nr:hypothetical protein Glove_25g11 [Diversispora epigaea]